MKSRVQQINDNSLTGALQRITPINTWTRSPVAVSVEITTSPSSAPEEATELQASPSLWQDQDKQSKQNLYKVNFSLG